MRVSVTLVDPHLDTRHDLVIEADDSTPTGEVLAALHGMVDGVEVEEPRVISLSSRRNRVQAPGGPAPVYLHGEPLDPSRPIAESGLKEGSLLSLSDPAASRLTEPDGVVEVRVVTGPGSGAVHRLLPGDASIGSDPACAIRLYDDRVPPVAAGISVTADGTTSVRAYADAAAVLAETVPHVDPALALDREALETDDTDWPLGGQLTVGDIILELEAVGRPDAAVEDSLEPGWIDYNRPPRLLAPDRQTSFRLPMEPEEQANRGLPWLVMFLPLVLAVVMAVMMKRPTYLLMGLMSPLMMVGNNVSNRKQGKVSFRQQLADYRDKKDRIEADVEQAIVDEKLARRLEAPDPALSLLIASGPRSRLWERRVTDPDYLSIRLGVGDLVSEVTVEDPAQLEHRRQTRRTAYGVPVTLSLAERGVVGVAATTTLGRQVGTWAVAQLAVLQSPRDTQVYVLTDQDGAATWDWLRWLPHAHPQLGQDTVVTLGSDAETCARRIAELSAALAARQKAALERQQATYPDIVVVYDGARRLRTLPGVVALLKQGPAVRIFSLCLDTDERLLPEEASAVVLQTPRGLTLRQQRITVVDDISPDLVDGPWLNRVARALAPIRDISGGESDSVLPAACRLTDVMRLEPLDADVVKARWAVQPRSTEAVIGISLDGPFAIDLRRDGPHGLVAGTTGAGKSELLQSIVASLAVANRPDGMTFVLVDYKGGAAFKDCVDLPHTVGMVTDLDTHLVERALVSLGAELTRREHLLADAGAKDIEDYVDLAAKRGGLADMPRLLIVIDEFASLARELPDFVSGLVNIAQRGRSLGIHLILATQRPGGVVSPEIRANTNLRIALRVTDGSESSDVIDAPDAGLISKSTPGRAYVRLGANSLVPFQSGRVGGRRPGAVATTTSAPWLAPVATTALTQPPRRRPRAEVVDDAEITDLRVLVEAVAQADADLGLTPQHSPWLPALTTDVLLDDLLPEAPTGDLPPIPYAVEDLPALQQRRPATIDFGSFSHLAIMGGPRSGRSQALRTMAAAIGRLTSPADVHVYGLDCGNGALLPIVDLPHCGAVVQRTQTDRALRLFARLKVELARRQELLAEGGYADLGELRASGNRLPHIVFLIDRWEGFMGGLAEADGGSPYETVQTLLREGASLGLHLVITGDKQVVSARLASLVEDKIGLRLADKADFGMIGLLPRKLPDDVPDGRGFRSESGIELQFALLDPDTSGQAQAAAIRRIGELARERYDDLPREERPFRVDVLPQRITFEGAWAMRPIKEPKPMWGLVAVGGDELTALGFDLAWTNAAIVAGPPRSGRSTALLAVVESLLRTGTELVIAAPRPSPLRDLAGREGVRRVIAGVDLSEEELAPLMENGPVVLVIDDGELLKDIPAKDYLRKLLRTGADRQQAIVLGGDSGEVASGFTGWQVDMKGRQGVLINPQGVTEGELIGVRIPRSATGNAATPGRVMVNVGDGVLHTAQVPTG
jgi:S-DNA-T family DNA segregation ATPase FtsK/SpoIIIE